MNKITLIFLILFILIFNSKGINGERISYFPFDGDYVDSISGLAAQAQSNNNHFSSGKYEQAAEIFASRVTSQSSFHTVGDMSVSFWIKLTNLNPNQVVMQSGRFRLTYIGSGEFAIYSNTPLTPFKNYYLYDTGQVITANQLLNWNHIVITVNSSMDTLFYVNGVKHNLPQPINGEHGETYIDTHFGGYISEEGYLGGNFSGLLDDVVIYNHILTDEEVIVSINESGVGPYIEAIPDQIILKDSEFVYQTVLDYPFGFNYSYNIETNPENTNIDISPEGELTWTPANSGIEQEIILEVISDGVVVDSASFVLIVTELDHMNLDFNDAAWTDQLVSDFIFGDKDSVSVFDSKWVGTDDLVTFNTNGTGGTVLKFNPGMNADLNSHISTPNYAIARDRILIESRVKLPQIKETDTLTLLRFVSQEDIGKSISFNLGMDSSNNLIPLLNYSGTDDYTPSSLIQNWQDKFERLGLEIWINRSNSPATYHAQFYHNDSALGDVININDLSWPSVNDFFVAITNIESLKRNFNDVGFEVDFVRIKQLDAPYQTGINGDSYDGELYVTENSSVSIVLDGKRLPGEDSEDDRYVLKRITNSPKEIEGWNDEGVIPDPDPEEVGVDSPFHGIFEINFGLTADDFIGSVIVDIFIKFGEGQFKRIGSKMIGVNSSAPNNIDWRKYYWNSRVPFEGGGSDDWSTSDANDPKREAAQLKFLLR